MKPSVNGRRGREEDPVEVLRSDLAALRRDLSDVTSSGVNKAKEIIHGATDSISGMAESAKETAGESHKKLGEFAGTRPLTTIALAMVAGAVGAKILSWRYNRD